MDTLQAQDLALVELGRWLARARYRFVTPTPETLRRVNARQDAQPARSLTDVFGWSRPFTRGTVDAQGEDLLEASGLLEPADRPHLGLWRSGVRFSSLPAADRSQGREADPDLLFVHSAWPTAQPDAVFFGPDTYRFVHLLRRVVRSTGRLVDVGCGTGAGGLAIAERVQDLVLADISPAALRHAAVNVQLSGPLAGVERVRSDVLAQVTGPIDAVIANPPYLVDPSARLYRDGGGPLGLDLSVRILREALQRVRSGGQIVMYTGSPVVRGQHPLLARWRELLATRSATYEWEELDPDVFGEELEQPAYGQVERIAVVALVVDVV